MKRTITLLLSLGMLANMSVLSYGVIAQETKNSIYLPQDSWIIAKLQEKIDATHYVPADGWKERVSVGYTCMDSGAPDVEKMNSVLQNNRGVGLFIPLQKEKEWPAMELYAGVEFEKPYEIADIIKAVSATNQPTEGGNCKVDLYNSGSSWGVYDREIEAMEREQVSISQTDFIFNEATKIYQVNMDTYTYGYILEDKDGKKLFWCCKAANEFETGKFYKLADVLNAYKEYKEKTTGINSWYTHWV